MAQVKADESSPIDTEPPQSLPESAINQPFSTSTAASLERRSSNVANTLRSTEEGISVKSKLLCMHIYSIIEAHVAPPRSRKEDMCRSSQSRARALELHLRLHFFIDELHFGVPST